MREQQRYESHSTSVLLPICLESVSGDVTVGARIQLLPVDCQGKLKSSEKDIRNDSKTGNGFAELLPPLNLPR
jgi:hypothetical protein